MMTTHWTKGLVVPQKVRDYVTAFDPEDLLGWKDPGHSSGPRWPRPFLR